MRVVKEADERKNEILDAADILFAQKGFDGTSTNDILEKVGIARGTLYYHFKSKEDIMDALIERISIRVLGMAREIADQKTIPVNERIIRVIMALNVNDDSDKALITQMHKPQNALMHQKMQRIILVGVTPILTGIVRDGIEQGLFSTPFPYESVEMIMTYTNAVFDDGAKESIIGDELISRIEAFIFNIERLLAAEVGSLIPYVMQIFEEKGGEDHE